MAANLNFILQQFSRKILSYCTHQLTITVTQYVQQYLHTVTQYVQGVYNWKSRIFNFYQKYYRFSGICWSSWKFLADWATTKASSGKKISSNPVLWKVVMIIMYHILIIESICLSELYAPCYFLAPCYKRKHTAHVRQPGQHGFRLETPCVVTAQ